jgi:integrase
VGQIRKRGKFYQIRYYRNGQRIEESTGYTAYEDARDELRKREAQVSDGVPLTARSVRLTFDDAVKDVEADYTTNRKRSVEELKRRIKLHLTPHFTGKPLRTITTADLRTFSAMRLEAGASPAEINRELAIVRRAFRLAVEADKYHGRVPKTPMLQERNVRTGFFDDAMVEAVKAHLSPALRAVVTFAYITGWRVQSEVLPLEWRCVDRKASEARLEPGTTKNQAGRVVSLYRCPESVNRRTVAPA